MAADRVYKRLDYDQIVYMINYIFTKLKGSPLTSNTTYTISKDEDGYIILVDSFGTVVSRVLDSDTIYTEANSSYSGLLSSTLYSKLMGIEDQAQVNVISSISANDVTLDVVDGNVNITIPTDTDIQALIESYSYQTRAQVETLIDEKTVGLYDLKGSVTNFSDLPTTNNKKGDSYNVINEFVLNNKKYPEGTNVAWDGTEWDPLGGSFDSSAYVKISDSSSLTTSQIGTAVNEAYNEIFGS